MIKGQVISGKFGEIQIRKKSGQDIELGELLIAEAGTSKILMQVYDLIFGSQISQQNLELISGMNLEEDNEIEFMDPHLRNYIIGMLKSILTINQNGAFMSKTLPEVFSKVRTVQKDDLNFLTKPSNSLFLGYLRSGSQTLDVPIFLNGKDVFTHHILIAGTTGKGKSVLMSNLIWDCVDKDYCSLLVLDPHDEYYGREKLGLKDHPLKEKISFYTSKNVPAGENSLVINIKNIKPEHFDFMDFSGPQRDAMNQYYKEYSENWIDAVALEKPIKGSYFEASLAVLKRRIMQVLDLDVHEKRVFCNGIFSVTGGENTIGDICRKLEDSKTVIIDTSNFSGSVELLIGSLITTEIFNKYKYFKAKGVLKDKPVISIILEEAPRVIGREVLEKGGNIFSTIAREGRKFKVGLTAITQLPSLIPREILSNINTKIILGIEMNTERNAIIESASQDLSSDSRSIASLDKGEAIISSNFGRFAIPVKIPFFDDVVKKQIEENKKNKYSKDFQGVKLE